jgi:transporter family protein
MKAWVIYSLLCLILWGLWGFVLKIGYSGSSWVQVYFLSSLASFTIALTVFLLYRAPISINKYAIIAAFAGVLGGLGYVFFVKALETGEASIVIPLTALYPALTAIVATSFLGEKLSAIKGLGIALAVVAAVLLSM